MTLRGLLLALAVVTVPACGGGSSGGGTGLLSSSPTLEGISTQNIAVNNAPAALVLADVNNDTHLDIVVGGAGGLQISRGSAGGVMTAAASPAGTSFNAVSGVAVGLLNNDLLPDLVVALEGSGDVEVYLNTGNATAPFNTFTGFAAAPDGLGGVALADLDDDGELDVVTANPQNHSVSVLLGSGTGSFGAATQYAAGLGARYVAAADFNGDGLPDLVTANELGDSLSVLLTNAGSPLLGTPEFLPTGDQPRCVAVADYTGDGRLDLAAVCYVSTELLVFPGFGDGTFGAPRETGILTGHAWVAAGDASEDGRQDLMVLGVNLFNPIFLAGRGNGTFLPFDVLDSLGDPVIVAGNQTAGALGDMNQDGLLDIVIAFGEFGSSTVTVRITGTVTP